MRSQRPRPLQEVRRDERDRSDDARTQRTQGARRHRHIRYNKTVQRAKKLYVHDETNDLHVGDRVRVMETRPLSKLKRWRVVEVLERAR